MVLLCRREKESLQVHKYIRGALWADSAPIVAGKPHGL
jgi:hypothetical protein